MAEHHDDTPETNLPEQPHDSEVPVEADETLEVETPRRAASAEFEVQQAVGSQALLREAMDPANQSLREALRLSYRLLQLVIVVLIVLFIFSGFQRIDSKETGVMLRAGRIMPAGAPEALEPGPHFSIWPYPVGEFIVFQDQNRRVELPEAFWPRMRPGQTLEEAVDNATIKSMLRPGQDGSLITADGSIAHMRIIGRYEIVDPVQFVQTVDNVDLDPEDLDADRLVELALQRAAVHEVAAMDLDTIVAFGEVEKEEIKSKAQQLLTDVGSGIRIVGVETPIDPTPAFAIKKAYGELQSRQQQAQQSIESARESAQQTLISIAGDQYGGVLELIEQYEAALELQATEEADELLTAINEQLEFASGEVTNIIQHAKAYRSEIEQTLGSEARRFSSLLPTFRDSPELVISELWSGVYRRVLGAADAEVMLVPGSVAMVKIQISGLDEVAEKRRESRLQTREQETTYGAQLRDPGLRRAADFQRQLEGQPGRRLDPRSGQ